MGKLKFKISEKTLSILAQDQDSRLALLKEAYPDADPRVLNNVQRALFCDNFIIALFENIITLEDANNLARTNMYDLALTDNGLAGLYEKLFTVTDIYRAKSEDFLINCVSDNGLKALRQSILTIDQIKALPTLDHLTYLMSDHGIDVLFSKKMTAEEAANYKDPLALKRDLAKLAGLPEGHDKKYHGVNIGARTQAVLQLPLEDQFEAVKMLCFDRKTDSVFLMMVANAMSEYLVMVLVEKLLTIPQVYNVLYSSDLREALFCRNGVAGLQEKLFTYEDLLGFRNENQLKDLLSDETLHDLRSGTVTLQVVKLRHEPKVANRAPVQTIKEKPAIEDPAGKIKFNRMLRYLESNCIRNDEAKDDDFDLLYYRLFNDLRVEMFNEPQCLLALLINVRNQLHSDSRFLPAIDKTIAQWVQGGMLTREAVEAKSIYTPTDLNKLLSAVYPPLENRQDALSAQVVSPIQRTEVVARLLADQYPSFEAQRDDLLKLFSLRKYHQPDPGLFERASHLKGEVSQFLFAIKQRDQWSDEKTLSAARQLLIQSLLMSDEILAALLQDLIKNQYIESADDPISSYLMIRLLINQGREFCRAFLNTGLFDFYASLRAEVIVVTSMITQTNALGELRCNLAEAKDTRFYKEEPTRNALRKMYNTFVKDGFAECFSDVKDEGYHFRAMLRKADERFDIWTKPDQIKESKGQYHKFRFFANEDKSKAATYEFPARWAKRPT